MNNATLVRVDNWGDAPKPHKPIYADKTTVQTYFLKGAGATPGETLWKQICDYEPNRTRLVIQVFDNDIAILTEPPRTSPDVDVPGSAPQGRMLPNSLNLEYVFFGKDAFFINPLAVAGSRVTVTREYC